tara:strand:- start:15436 stop:15993 length:558 start_codon:yes stop_codon:yes gene_type:complete
MDLKEQKKLLRLKFKRLRGKSSQLERENVKINVEKYLNNISLNQKSTGHIGIYWPMKNEVDLRDLKKEYRIALPKCKSERILKFHIWDTSPLTNDFEGIPSPDNLYHLDHNQISTLFIPCLAVDKAFNRLGYGGGYFDRLRANKSWKEVKAIGVLTSRCISDDLLAHSEFDIPLSGYITDKEIVL